jgi:general secretion pathway protein G
MFTKRLRQRGFTLLELLTVMTILALLATVGIVGYRRHTKAAKESVLKEDLFQQYRRASRTRLSAGHSRGSHDGIQGYLGDGAGTARSRQSGR